MVWPHSVMSTDSAFLLLLEFPVASYAPDGNVHWKSAKEKPARHRICLGSRSMCPV